MSCKSLILCSAILVLMAVSSADARFTRVTRDGGPHGFKDTWVERDGDETYIECSGPGWTKCPDKSVVPVEQDLVDYAVLQIELGNLNGLLTDPGSGLTVSWDSDDVEMSNSDIVVE